MKTTLLLDADIIAYKFACKGEKLFKFDPNEEPAVTLEPLEDITPLVDDYIAEFKKKLKATDVIVCLSCTTVDGWRYALWDGYKAGRGRKPHWLAAVKDHMEQAYPSYRRPTMEADDIMGILSTHPTLIPGKKIIFSEDKDMKTIPGWLFNPAKDVKPRLVTLDEADGFHMLQALMGDSTDGYKGCPGIGPMKAAAILFGVSPPWGHPEEMWPAIVATYKSKGLTEEDALLQARLARICRHTEYDFKKKEVILWEPTKS